MQPLNRRLKCSKINNFSVKKIEECAKKLVRARYTNGITFDKYSRDRYERVAVLPLPEIELELES